jgi:hypothetical protein
MVKTKVFFSKINKWSLITHEGTLAEVGLNNQQVNAIDIKIE